MYKLKKTHVIIILTQILCFLFAEEGWHTQNPYPSESWYLSIEVVSEDTIFIGGMGGNLVSTYNAGQTWNVEKIPDIVDIRSISFANNKNGYFIDSDHLYKTINGGIDWFEINTDFDFETYFLNYLSCEESVLYLILKPKTVSIDGLINAQTHLYKSMDGGDTWNRVDITMKGRELCTFFWINIMDIFMLKNILV